MTATSMRALSVLCPAIAIALLGLAGVGEWALGSIALTSGAHS
jgi:hypothetical protein